MYEQRLPIEEWKAKKQAELKETIAAQKSVLQEVVQDGQRLADYLYGRGRLGSHITSGNAALVLQVGQRPQTKHQVPQYQRHQRKLHFDRECTLQHRQPRA